MKREKIFVEADIVGAIQGDPYDRQLWLQLLESVLLNNRCDNNHKSKTNIFLAIKFPFPMRIQYTICGP